MIGFEKPEIRKSIEEDRKYGKFEIEPLARGYGLTLGNALRRVLIGSFPGAAVTSIKIDGVLHEFSSIPGVREDVTEIILNLKQLAVKITGDETKRAIINAVGPKVVTAADIMADFEVEIFNKDLHIATLEDNVPLVMDLYISRGLGYVPAEQNKSDDTPISVIPIDSIFTPIKKVNFTVEDKRIGQYTNYDKLIMEVWTDESITPDESLSIAGKTLIDHLQLFMGVADVADGLEIMIEKKEDLKEKSLEMNIEDLDLSVRSYNCLKRAAINTVEDLICKTEDEMIKVRNLGRKSLDEIRYKLKDLGLSLRDNDE